MLFLNYQLALSQLLIAHIFKKRSYYFSNE